jgi:hypothetical protein
MDVGPSEVTSELLEALYTNGLRGDAADGDLDLWERDAVPVGEQDSALTALAGFVRAHPRWRLSEAGMHHFLEAACSNGTLERDPSRRPYSDRDFARIARSIGSRPVGEPDFEIMVPKLAAVSGEESYVGPPVKWWLPHFFPQAELVMLYGAKAAGKSTTASWLASVVTRRGGNFLHIGVEEPFQRFLARAVLGGADRTRIRSLRDAMRVRLPGTIDLLREYVEEAQIDVVFFDSIYSHFDAGQNVLESTRARTCLSPLAEMAQKTGCMVIGVFHDRRADGSYMGSTEMINVARVILKLSRAQGAASRLRVHTTNFSDPGYALRLDADEHEVVEPQTGETQMEEQEDGTFAPMKVRVVRNVERVSDSTDGATSTQIERPSDAIVDSF